MLSDFGSEGNPSGKLTNSPPAQSQPPRLQIHDPAKPPPVTQPPTLTAPEVARLLKVSYSTIRRKLASGLLPDPVSNEGAQRRWRKDEILRWIVCGCPSNKDWRSMSGPSGQLRLSVINPTANPLPLLILTHSQAPGKMSLLTVSVDPKSTFNIADAAGYTSTDEAVLGILPPGRTAAQVIEIMAANGLELARKTQSEVV